jgi:uncharacterized protein YdcH (DUF465 family)
VFHAGVTRPLSGSETLKGRNPAQTHQGSVIDSLLNKYSQADAEVVKAEQAKSSDDAVKKLKETRLMVKDKIVKQLSRRPESSREPPTTGG